MIHIDGDIIPIFVLEKHEKTSIIEEHENAYILTNDGLYLQRGKSDVILSIGKCNIQKCDSFGEGTPKIQWKAEKLQYNLFCEATKFFYDIYDKYKTEAAVILFYHPVQKDWRIVYPIQLNLSGASVTYVFDFSSTNASSQAAIQWAEKNEKTDILKSLEDEILELKNNGYILLGTIHSHCNFSAFHSGVDDNDEFGFDGLHITVGNLVSGLSFAQRITGYNCFLKKDSISDVVDFQKSEKEFAEDFLSLTISTFVEERVFKNKDTTYYHYKGGLHQKLYSWWDRDDNSGFWYKGWKKPKPKKGDIVKVRLGKKTYIGLIVDDNTNDEDFYLVTTENHSHPLYVEDYHINVMTGKELKEWTHED